MHFYTTDSEEAASRNLDNVAEIDQAIDKARRSKSIEEINKLENVVRKLASCKARQPSIIDNKQKLQIESNCVEMFVNENETASKKHEEMAANLTMSKPQTKRNVADMKDLEVVGTAMKITVCDETNETVINSVVKNPDNVLDENIRQDNGKNNKVASNIDTDNTENVHRKLASSKQRHPKSIEKTDKVQEDTILTNNSSENPPVFGNEISRDVINKDHPLEVIGTAMKIIEVDDEVNASGGYSTRKLRSSAGREKNELRESVCEKEKEMTIVELSKRKTDQCLKTPEGQSVERTQIKGTVSSNTKGTDDNVLKDHSDTSETKRTDMIDRGVEQTLPEDNDLERSMRYKPDARNYLLRRLSEGAETKRNTVARSDKQKSVHVMLNVEEGKVPENIRVSRQTKIEEKTDSVCYNAKVKENKYSYASKSVIADLKNRCEAESPNFEKALKRYLLDDSENLDKTGNMSLLDMVKRQKTSTETLDKNDKEHADTRQDLSKGVTKSDTGRNLFEAIRHGASLTNQQVQDVSGTASPRTLRSMVSKVKPETNCVPEKPENMSKARLFKQELPPSNVSSSDVRKSLKIIGQKMKIHKHIDKCHNKELEITGQKMKIHKIMDEPQVTDQWFLKRTLRSSRSCPKEEMIASNDKTEITQCVQDENNRRLTLRRSNIPENTGSTTTEQNKLHEEKKEDGTCKSLNNEATYSRRALRSSSARLNDARSDKSKKNKSQTNVNLDGKIDFSYMKRRLRSSSAKEVNESKINKHKSDQNDSVRSPIDKEAKVFLKKLRFSSARNRLDMAETSNVMKRKSVTVNKHLDEDADHELYVSKKNLRSSDFKEKKEDIPSNKEKKRGSSQGDPLLGSMLSRSSRMVRSQSFKGGTGNTTETDREVIDLTRNIIDNKKECYIDVRKKNFSKDIQASRRTKTLRSEINIVDSSDEISGIRKNCTVKLIDVSPKPRNMAENNANPKADTGTVKFKGICRKKMGTAKNINNSSLRSELEDFDSTPRFKRAKTIQVCRPEKKEQLDCWDRRLEVIGHHIQERNIIPTIRGIEFPV